MSNKRFSDVLTRGFPYIINTLFDAIFTILGIVVGSSFGLSIDIRAITSTMVTASLSLGVSSGFSVYEAQSIQEDRRIDKIEEAMLTDLEGMRAARASASSFSDSFVCMFGYFDSFSVCIIWANRNRKKFFIFSCD